MAPDGTDGSQDWALAGSARPPLIGELVERIDEAIAIASASEEAVMAVGAAALDAAEQARRAAELAERASASMIAGRAPTASRPDSALNGGSEPARAELENDGLRDFAARADRISARLRELECLPLAVAS